MRYNYLVLVVFLAVGMSAQAQTKLTADNKDGCQILSRSKEIQRQIEKTRPRPAQMIVVKSLNGSRAKVVLCQRSGSEWKPVLTPSFRAVIGKNGMAAIGEKKEGDLKTPAGLYPLGEAFGTEPLVLKMDYKYITADDKFIDDAHHKDYNRWVSGLTDAKSYESMLTAPYRYGAVINYNQDPTIVGKGSAIFIHLWRSPNTPTAGCIALDQKDLLRLLHWLDKAQYPHIFVH